MDVRCDRCETEYELDDDSVTEGGASVQCTTCGHTFVVGPDGVTIAQIVPTPPGGLADLGPQAADWLLATEDGQTHRFRDLTTLQKWVVERKATREDRVSQRGGPWLPLGEVDELAPFFAVVDQADRARSSEGGRIAVGGRPTGWRRGRRRRGRPRFRAPGRAGARTAWAGTACSRRASTRDRLPSLDPGTFPPDDGRGEDQFETMTLFRRSRNIKIAGAAGFVALASVAAFIAFRHAQPAKPVAACGRGSRAGSIAAATGRGGRDAAGRQPRRRSPPFRRRRPPPRASPSPPPRTRRLRPPARSLRSPRRTSGWSARRIA